MYDTAVFGPARFRLFRRNIFPGFLLGAALLLASQPASACPTPVITRLGPNTICNGTSTTLKAPSCPYGGDSNCPFTYQWLKNGVPIGANDQTYGAGTTGNYSVTVTDSSLCSATSAKMAISVLAKPAPTITASGPTTFCQGGSVVLSAPLGLKSYFWSPGNQTTRSIVASASGPYSVTVVNSQGCDGTSAPTVVTVNTIPTAHAYCSGSICFGDTAKLTGTGGTSCSWTPADGLDNALSCTPIASPTHTTTYSLVVSSNGCKSTNQAKVTLQVNSKPTPTLFPVGPLTICPGGSVKISAQVGYASYLWSGPGVSGSTTTSIMAMQAGDYMVTVTYPTTNCSGTSAAVHVIVDTPPDAPEIAPISCVTGNSTSNATCGGNGSDTFTWSVTPGSIVSGQGTQSVTYTTPSPGTSALLSATETDSIGCTGDAGTETVWSQFADVSGNVFAPAICDVERAGVIQRADELIPGCPTGDYCPSATPTREQMAVYVLLAKNGSLFDPGSCSSAFYADMTCADPLTQWVNELEAEGITDGCGSGNYCPTALTTREQMAKFIVLAKGELGEAVFVSKFTDVTSSNPYWPWINKLYDDGAVVGCGSGNYCPSDPVLNDQMAQFLDYLVTP